MNFMQFAAASGLVVRDIVPDGRIRRCATADHPHRKNGAYMFNGDWGFVQNWATQPEPQIWQGDQSTAQQIDPARLRELAARRAEEIRIGQERAAKHAEQLLSQCELTQHAYLDRKGFPSELGLVDDERRLLIPMRDCQDYRRTLSVQRITVEGEKRFLLGGRTKGAIYVFGGAKSLLSWLCEGYATGLSIHAAMQMMRLQGRVVVCFSAANLAHVASLIGGRRLVIADNDASGTGADFARTTGLPWGMPDEINADANDLHMSRGIYALCRLMQEVMRQG